MSTLAAASIVAEVAENGDYNRQFRWL